MLWLGSYNYNLHRLFLLPLVFLLWSCSAPVETDTRTRSSVFGFMIKPFILQCFLSVLLQSVTQSLSHDHHPPPAALTPHYCSVPDIRRKVEIIVMVIYTPLYHYIYHYTIIYTTTTTIKYDNVHRGTNMIKYFIIISVCTGPSMYIMDNKLKPEPGQPIHSSL